MTKRRNKTIYRAQFGRLKLNAFGIANTIDWSGAVELYQARVSPELWRARPNFTHGAHKWEASSADGLMRIIEADFEETIKPWRPWVVDLSQPRWPFLRPATPGEESKAG